MKLYESHPANPSKKSPYEHIGSWKGCRAKNFWTVPPGPQVSWDATTVDSGMVKTAPRQAPIMEVPLPTGQVGNKGVNKIGQEEPEIATQSNWAYGSIPAVMFSMLGKTWQTMRIIEATYCQVCHQLMTWYKLQSGLPAFSSLPQFSDLGFLVHWQGKASKTEFSQND